MATRVSDLEAGEGDEDEDLDSQGFRDDEVDENDEKGREEKDEVVEEATSFNGNVSQILRPDKEMKMRIWIWIDQLVNLYTKNGKTPKKIKLVLSLIKQLK